MLFPWPIGLLISTVEFFKEENESLKAGFLHDEWLKSVRVRAILLTSVKKSASVSRYCGKKENHVFFCIYILVPDHFELHA